MPSEALKRLGVVVIMPYVEVFWRFLMLGCMSFGGPVAHLGYFRALFVERLGWLDEAAYGQLVALSQFLPGPSSSQVGFAIGVHRAGFWGSIDAFVGFAAPLMDCFICWPNTRAN